VKNKLRQNSVNEVWSGLQKLDGLQAAGGPDGGDKRESRANKLWLFSSFQKQDSYSSFGLQQRIDKIDY